MPGDSVTANNREQVICNYFGCPERATKNLTVTESNGPGWPYAEVETYEVPYCDIHYEEQQ